MIEVTGNHLRKYGMLRSLIRDEAGFTLTMESILVATITLLGVTVGLTTMRNSLIQEFGDAAASMSSIDHGYQYAESSFAFALDNVDVQGQAAGAAYVDESNFCEPAVVDAVDAAPMCLSISSAAIEDEG